MSQKDTKVTITEIENQTFLTFWMKDGSHRNIHLEDISVNRAEKDFLLNWAKEKINDI